MLISFPALLYSQEESLVQSETEDVTGSDLLLEKRGLNGDEHASLEIFDKDGNYLRPRLFDPKSDPELVSDDSYVQAARGGADTGVVGNEDSEGQLEILFNVKSTN